MLSKCLKLILLLSFETYLILIMSCDNQDSAPVQNNNNYQTILFADSFNTLGGHWENYGAELDTSKGNPKPSLMYGNFDSLELNASIDFTQSYTISFDAAINTIGYLPDYADVELSKNPNLKFRVNAGSFYNQVNYWFIIDSTNILLVDNLNYNFHNFKAVIVRDSINAITWYKDGVKIFEESNLTAPSIRIKLKSHANIFLNVDNFIVSRP